MIPKEKAKELYNEFSQWVHDTENCTDEMNVRFTKQCMKIHVHQILDKIKKDLEYYHELIKEIDEL